MTGNHASKQAVVLSGGGANGGFEVGVLKALTEGASPATGFQPLDPSIISGTSVGGYNAAVLVSNSDLGGQAAVAALEDAWLTQIAESATKCGNGVYRFRGDPLPYLQPRCVATHPLLPLATLTRDAAFFTGDAILRTASLLSSSGPITSRLLAEINLADFVDVDRFHRTIDATVNLAAIRQSAWKLFVIASDWNHGVPRVFRNPDFTDGLGHLAVAASAAIPGIFPAVRIEGELYVDGGLVANTPLKPAIAAGATELHVIFLEPYVADINLPLLPNTLNTFYRALAVLWANAVRQDIQIARAINAALAILDRVVSGGEISYEESLVYLKIGERIQKRRSSDRPPYRRIPVHSYRPPRELGGLLEMLDFGRQRTEELIELGCQTAINHDCEVEGCSIPGQFRKEHSANFPAGRIREVTS